MLAERIEQAIRNNVTIRFTGDGADRPIGELWESAAELAPCFERFGAVGTVLLNDAASIETLFAAIRAGVRLVSLPTPPRGFGSEHYLQWISTALAAAGARAVLVPAQVLPLLGDSSLPGLETLNRRSLPEVDGPSTGRGFELVQFTSGTTGWPKGVLVRESSIARNASATLERISPGQGATVVTWLPLSHDMGMIGTLITALCAGATYSKGGRIVVMRPEDFIRRPSLWLDACSEFRAEVTAAPDFALRQAVRSARAGGALDLASLRCCLIGGELVRAETLDLFSSTFADVGLKSKALCPAYGAAESTLAVSISSPSDPWRTLADAGSREPLVSCGQPLAGVTVRVVDADDGGAGIIEVGGDCLMDGYVSQDGVSGVGDDGFWWSGDHGYIVDHQVFPLGRNEDRLHVAGRNVAAVDVETAVCDAGIRPGRVMAVADPESTGFVILCEAAVDDNIEELAARVASSVVRSVEMNPNLVIFCPYASLPRTPSGKKRRVLASQLLADGELPFIGAIRFRGATVL